VSKILVLGGTGMLGHVLWRECRARHETYATVRRQTCDGALDPEATASGVQAEKPETVERALEETSPDVVVNCIGVVKQADAAADPVTTIGVNSLFPHVLAELCARRSARLIHLSTDCVFSGRRGSYTERDEPDPVDLYGRSKLLGEPSGPGVLTLRTSMIGWELGGRRHGLLEWFAAQAGETVTGYTRARFTGPTAPVLARAIADVAERHPGLGGIWHVGAEPIAKHDLLVALREALGLGIEIVPDDEVVIDRSLNTAGFRTATGWSPPPWDEMVAELAADAPARTRGETLARR
jgi:dTDP-4-dehydrorhamnose reductase